MHQRFPQVEVILRPNAMIRAKFSPPEWLTFHNQNAQREPMWCNLSFSVKGPWAWIVHRGVFDKKEKPFIYPTPEKIQVTSKDDIEGIVASQNTLPPYITIKYNDKLKQDHEAQAYPPDCYIDINSKTMFEPGSAVLFTLSKGLIVYKLVATKVRLKPSFANLQTQTSNSTSSPTLLPCSVCKFLFAKTEYSATQISKKAKRKCKSCVEKITTSNNTNNI